MKIGICDWGIGGLGVYKGIREEIRSSVDVIYFSDAGYTPYGKVPAKELKQRWIEVKSYLINQGVEKIIIACNALSTVVDPTANIITISSVVKDLLIENKNDDIVVIGGHRTIESGIYDLGFGKYVGKIAQPLSALVERGILAGEEVDLEIKKVIDYEGSIGKVMLACTHYPALMPEMKKLYPNIEFVDPSSSLIKELNLPNSGCNTIRCFTTGDIDQMKVSAQKAWGIDLDEVEKVEF